MTKKHLITCSVMLVVFFISAFDLCDATAFNKANATHHSNAFSVIKTEEKSSEYSFANKALPVYRPRVKRKLSYSLWMHSYTKVQTNALHKKAAKLFPIIEPILAYYGIPDDFKYIPLVESGLKGGTSPKGARGLWQFMPGTARHYGLKVNRKRDERLLTRKSTIAACKYLRELYSEFGDWTLAAAAYNNGSVKIAKAMRKQKTWGYYTTRFNRETGSYVYKLVAMKEIIENPAKYGYKSKEEELPQLVNLDKMPQFIAGAF